MKEKENQYGVVENIVFREEELKIIIREGVLSRVNSKHGITAGIHEEIEIKYFYDGSATLMVGTEVIAAQPGDILIASPYEIHSTIQLGENEGKYHSIIIGLDSLMDKNGSGIDLRNLLIKQGYCFCHLVRGSTRMQQILVNMIEEYKHKENNYIFVIKHLVSEFVFLLMREGMHKSNMELVPNERTRYYIVVEPAIQKIQEDYKEKLTVDELAVLCNVSKHHFCRIFKLVTGMTVVEYLTDYRFKIAEIMFVHTERSIGEVARLCGFETESYFCRRYKKKFGISPYQRKKKIAENIG